MEKKSHLSRQKFFFVTSSRFLLPHLLNDEIFLPLDGGMHFSKYCSLCTRTHTNAHSRKSGTSLQYTKEQYLKNVRNNFKNANDIALKFSSFQIHRKNDEHGVYGISMRQQYQSNTYADEGHLFLLVDFLQKNPQIYVRSWQPQEWNDSEIIQLSNFKMYK
ncbi:MAG: hypothetical protein FJ218_07215 [Ignavibacteria bacterium]|nr:hypothetical protein [Ignavibacteria bacterium]